MADKLCPSAPRHQPCPDAWAGRVSGRRGVQGYAREPTDQMAGPRRPPEGRATSRQAFRLGGCPLYEDETVPRAVMVETRDDKKLR